MRRLGFSEERVEECLRAISGVDLEEACDWVRDHLFDCCGNVNPCVQLYTVCDEQEIPVNGKNEF